MRAFHIASMFLVGWLVGPAMAFADGRLDGRVFSGMIGPTENPDLNDSLHFNDGYFWSDICTRCGFQPGPYTAQVTDDGIRFTGILESGGPGRFSYDGIVAPDGSINVLIKWERKRWYWTASRDIAFLGADAKPVTAKDLKQIRSEMEGFDPSSNPMCANF